MRYNIQDLGLYKENHVEYQHFWLQIQYFYTNILVKNRISSLLGETNINNVSKSNQQQLVTILKLASELYGIWIGIEI